MQKLGNGYKGGFVIVSDDYIEKDVGKRNSN